MATANRRYIKRSVTVSHCVGQCVNGFGEFVDYDSDLTGSYTPDRATRVLRRLTGDQSITIVDVVQETARYSMSIEDFIKHATKE